MGLFGGSYMKPGKGVDKNEPKKKGFFLFFDIIVHKFTKFIGLNCLYTMASILWIAALFLFANLILSGTNIVESITDNLMSASAGISREELAGSIQVMLQFTFAMTVFTLWGSGPATAAYAYITRCFTRAEHAWVLSDSVDKFKENFKQGMFVVIMDAVVLAFGLNAAHFYYSLYVSSGSILWMLLTYIMALVFIIYTMMHPYLYQIMVTFECKIGALYKNALLITLAKLPGNVFTLAVGVLVLGLLFTLVNPLAASLFIAVLGLCLTSYPGEFYAARVIERSILRDMKEKTEKQPKIEYIGEEEAE